MAKKKDAAFEAATEEVVEEVEVVNEPTGNVVRKEDPVVADKEENPVQQTYLNQDDAMIVGKYLSALRRKTNVEGEITGVEIREGHAFWSVLEGPVLVLIPFREALPYLEDPTLMEDANRQRQFMTKAIGTKIAYSVEEMVADGDTFIVFGSRKVALERIRKRHFGKNASNPIKVGDNITATFIGVAPNAGWVTSAGVDIRLPKRLVSHRYIENLMREYKAGDQITLVVQEIEEKNGLPILVTSALPCELEACKSRLRYIRKGSRLKAVITAHRIRQRINPVTKKAEPYYAAALWVEGANVPGYATLTTAYSPETCRAGDEVSVEVMEIAQNGYVRCRIVAYLP